MHSPRGMLALGEAMLTVFLCGLALGQQTLRSDASGELFRDDLDLALQPALLGWREPEVQVYTPLGPDAARGMLGAGWVGPAGGGSLALAAAAGLWGGRTEAGALEPPLDEETQRERAASAELVVGWSRRSGGRTWGLGAWWSGSAHRWNIRPLQPGSYAPGASWSIWDEDGEVLTEGAGHRQVALHDAGLVLSVGVGGARWRGGIDIAVSGQLRYDEVRGESSHSAGWLSYTVRGPVSGAEGNLVLLQPSLGFDVEGPLAGDARLRLAGSISAGAGRSLHTHFEEIGEFTTGETTETVSHDVDYSGSGATTGTADFLAALHWDRGPLTLRGGLALSAGGWESRTVETSGWGDPLEPTVEERRSWIASGVLALPLAAEARVHPRLDLWTALRYRHGLTRTTTEDLDRSGSATHSASARVAVGVRWRPVDALRLDLRLWDSASLSDESSTASGWALELSDLGLQLVWLPGAGPPSPTAVTP